MYIPFLTKDIYAVDFNPFISSQVFEEWQPMSQTEYGTVSFIIDK